MRRGSDPRATTGGARGWRDALAPGLLLLVVVVAFAAREDGGSDDRPDRSISRYPLALPSAKLSDGLTTYPVTSVERTAATANATVVAGGPAARGFVVSDEMPSIGIAAGGGLGSPALSTERVRRELAGYLALGVGHVRADAPWAQIERTPGVYDWSWPDRWIPEAHALGLDVVVTFAYSPPWVTGAAASDKVGPATAEERDAYAAAAAALVRRYPYVTAIEIWNEPNHAGFWAAPDPAAYADVLRRAHAAIKAVAPGVQILGGVLALPPPGEGVMPVPFLEGMYAAGAHGTFDALAVHPYIGNDESIYWESWNAFDGSGSWFGPAPSVLAVLQANEPGKRIWFTETGDTALAATSPATVPKILDKLREYQSAGWGGPIFWYAWRSIDSYSFVDENMSPRPAYAVFRDYIASVFAGAADRTFDARAGADGAYSAALTGLEPGTTYWVRAYASDGSRTRYGGVWRFTTAH